MHQPIGSGPEPHRGRGPVGCVFSAGTDEVHKGAVDICHEAEDVGEGQHHGDTLSAGAELAAAGEAQVAWQDSQQS